MSGNIGKKGSTLIKGEATSKLLSQGVKNLVFYHQDSGSGGETAIPFGSLNNPSIIEDYTPPTVNEILSANIGFYRNNVRVLSSSRGELMQGMVYVVRSSQIKFINGFVSEPNEVFRVELENKVVTANNITDSRALVATGVLLAGETTFNVGESFRVNENPTSQIGAIAVYKDGILQMRNVDNVTATLLADGNYEESSSTSVEFNEPELVDTAIVVYSLGSMSERPDLSMMQYIDTLAGQLDAMIPVLADVSGLDEDDFQGAPNNVDLKRFQDKVTGILNLEISKHWETTIDLAGSGAFTTGTLIVAREGRIVTIEVVNAIFSSAVTVLSDASILPSWAIPSNSESNVHFVDTGNIRRIRALADGSIQLAFYNASFIGTALSASSPQSLTYIVDDGLGYSKIKDLI